MVRYHTQARSEPGADWDLDQVHVRCLALVAQWVLAQNRGAGWPKYRLVGRIEP